MFSMSASTELLFIKKLTNYEFALLESQIEQAENKIREEHNMTCKTKDIMAYRSDKFIKATKIIRDMRKKL